ncbi:histidine kinase [Altibacter sp.]|uniref:sensor histidine kinase n=1 Tax=Altibacter sp. TaxID=2024823 RepID=UPI00258F080F|nr:histidine kinase [Altibacter sp.]MCW9037634.1 histidine kinase [Altibacter sp.]
MNTRTFLISLLFVLLIWNVSFAQRYQNYNIEHGLPSNHVYRISQDADGFIWIITDKGISKFNGSKFQNFTTRNGLPSNDIWDIRITPDRKIWYFSKASELGYIYNDSVYRFPVCEAGDVLYPTSTNTYGNTVVLGNSNEWFYLSASCWESFSMEHSNSKIPKAFPKLLERFHETKKDGATNLKYRNKDSLGFLLYDEGYAVMDFNKEELYIRYFRNTNSPKHPNFLRNHYVNQTLQLTGFHFNALLDDTYHMTSLVDIPQAFQSHFSFQDRSGNIWIATFNNGVYMLPVEKRNNHYYFEDKKVKALRSVGSKLIANVYDEGFYLYDLTTKTFVPYLKEKGFLYNAMYIPEVDRYFFTTENNILTTKSLKESPKTIARNRQLRSLLYWKGSLFGNTAGGLERLHPETLQIEKQWPQVGIKSMTIFKDNLYMGTSNGLRLLTHDAIHTVQPDEALLSYPILTLSHIGPDQLLIGTDGFGAYITDIETTYLLERSDFASIEDAYVQDNMVWLATEQGVLQYEKHNGRYTLKRKFDESDGLPSKKINSVFTVNDTLIASTDTGIVFVPTETKQKSHLLNIYISKVSYGDQILSNEQPVTEYRSNSSLTFSVDQINYAPKHTKVSYEYRLLPIQQQWSSTASGTITFNELAPAPYKLEVKCEDKRATFEVEITPLWHQTMLFKAGMFILAIVILGMVLFLIRKHELAKKTQKIQAEKKLAENELYALRSQMNPHFVFNSLAAIQYYINNNEMETSERYLVKFSRLIRQFFELSKQKEISVAEEISLLKNYLEIEKMRFKEKLQYAVHLDKKISSEAFTIPTMLLQPVVENAVNHGIFNKTEAGKVHIRFNYISSQTIQISVEDDGVGVVQRKSVSDKRLKSSQVLEERILQLNKSGQWEISMTQGEVDPSQLNRGYRTTFTIKRML